MVDREVVMSSFFPFVCLQGQRKIIFLSSVLFTLIFISCDFKYFPQVAATSQKHVKMTLVEDLKAHL